MLVFTLGGVGDEYVGPACVDELDFPCWPTVFRFAQFGSRPVCVVVGKRRKFVVSSRGSLGHENVN